MATTPEGKVKKAVTKILNTRGAYYFFPMTGGYGKSGVPDIVACYLGRFIAIECKAGKNKPTLLQERQLEEISDAGGIAWVVRETNVDSLEDLLDAIQRFEDRGVHPNGRGHI